jgi:hypothetical protein
VFSQWNQHYVKKGFAMLQQKIFMFLKDLAFLMGYDDPMWLENGNIYVDPVVLKKGKEIRDIIQNSNSYGNRYKSVLSNSVYSIQTQHKELLGQFLNNLINMVK